MTFSLFSSASSELELRSTTLALKISKALHRTPHAFEEVIESVLNHLSGSTLFSWGSIDVTTSSGVLTRWSFGAQKSLVAETSIGSYRQSTATVLVRLVPLQQQEESKSKLLPEYIAQQIGLSVVAREIARSNELLRQEISIERESLALRKFMARAKAIIMARTPLSADQAEGFLVASSVRTGRPLVKVAEEIRLALGLPEKGFRWVARSQPVRPLPWRNQLLRA